MSALKTILRVGLAMLPFVAGAAPFRNMGFDQPEYPLGISSPIEAGIHFDGDVASWVVPGWVAYSSVGYNYTQSFGQMASLLDKNYRNTLQPANPAKVPVIGTFSLGIWPAALGGDFPYVLRQTGDVPAGSQSFRFLYEGNNLTVYVGGSPVVVHRLEDRPSGDPEIGDLHYFAVDVSPFAGQTAELRFDFRSFGNPPIDGPPIPGLPDAKMHVLDDLSFSPLPAVPEPATWALFGVGLGALLWCHRRRN